jgi:hypothetical protein
MAVGLQIGIVLLCGMTSARAQAVVSTQAGLIDLTQGEVYVDDELVRATAETFFSLKDGQVLRTGRGRAEVLLGPEVFLRLGSQGAVRMENNRLDDTRIDIEKGTALVELVETIKRGQIQIVQGEARIELKSWGLYRFDADRGELRVFGGEARVTAGDRKTAASRGRAIQLSGALEASKFDAKQADGLQRWAARRSFQLFVSSAEARARRTDWEFTVTGWVWNRNFNMRFFSAVAAAEHRRRHGSADRAESALH